MNTKLDEADFFFSKMIENQFDPDQLYYLSAFLSAARSVLQQNVLELVSWRDLKKEYTDDWDLVDFFRLKRNFSIHHGQVVPGHVKIEVSEHLHLEDSLSVYRDGELESVSAPAPAPNVQSNASAIERTIYFTDVPDSLSENGGEVFDLCRRYLRCLENILADMNKTTRSDRRLNTTT